MPSSTPTPGHSGDSSRTRAAPAVELDAGDLHTADLSSGPVSGLSEALVPGAPQPDNLQAEKKTSFLGSLTDQFRLAVDVLRMAVREHRSYIVTAALTTVAASIVPLWLFSKLAISPTYCSRH